MVSNPNPTDQLRTAVALLASTPPVAPKDPADKGAGTMPTNPVLPPSPVPISLTHDYQPLNKRPPSRKLLRPLASHFEALLDSGKG